MQEDFFAPVGASSWGLVTEPGVLASAWAGCPSLLLISPGALGREKGGDTALEADDSQSRVCLGL